MVLASQENHRLADHSAAEKGAGNVALTLEGLYKVPEFQHLLKQMKFPDGSVAAR